MTRIKRGLVSHQKHKKLLSLTKGYRGTKRRLVKVAREAALHAGEYAFAGRKNKKRDFRRLWITRISEAAKQNGISYSRFIAGLNKNNIKIDRKILSDLVLNDTEAFKKIVDAVK
ncbi:MAG: 50S ribosomal protein L20 [Candidatus Levybacteria bacterium RIFCSPHIGHO2_01_FULL_40_15b]|nr:MAG: 50S ribosomal protein L20 [Candidatus Levybacteria bacterium RIFCSPHIGHO2_01_FULL_40_15b]